MTLGAQGSQASALAVEDVQYASGSGDGLAARQGEDGEAGRDQVAGGVLNKVHVRSRSSRTSWQIQANW